MKHIVTKIQRLSPAVSINLHKGVSHRLKFIPRAKSRKPKTDPRARGASPDPARLHRLVVQHDVDTFRLMLLKIDVVEFLQLAGSMQPLE